MTKGSRKTGYTIKDFQDKSLPKGAVGSYESVHSPYYPNVYEESRSQAMKIHRPSISFRTEVLPKRAFIWILKGLEAAGFEWLWKYKGPKLGIDLEDPEPPSIDSVLDTLKVQESDSVVSRGLKAILLHKKKGVIALVTIKPSSKTKIKVKVKGVILKSQWTTFLRSIKKRFKHELQ
jgi:hypothetical protein